LRIIRRDCIAGTKNTLEKEYFLCHNHEMSNLPTRINKYLADQKIASRREADALISSKKVKINGKTATLGQMVEEGDKVEVVGTTKKNVYLAYYKGRGVISHSPSEGEVDIVTRLKKDYHLTNLAPVGRLDKDSEGLIIITNDGRITAPLLSPESSNQKEYEVTVDKPVTGMFIKLMSLGVDIEGYTTKPTTITASTRNDKRFNIILTEGKKHQIRRMCAALGYQVKSLKRVRVMNITIGALKPNQYRKIAGEELKQFLKLLGL
jgi:23S rRNA pseudouridine2604 synthase